MSFNILTNYSEDDSDLSNDNLIDDMNENLKENEINDNPNKEHLKNIFNYEYNLDDDDDDKSNKYDKYV